MPSRTFSGSDSHMWMVWLVQPVRAVDPGLRIPGVWLAFQNEDESERRRLYEFPPDWAELPDERLDLLRSVAAVVTRPSRK